MSDAVLKSFLVRVGYEEHGREQIGKSLGSITAQAGVLALAFKGAASSIEEAVGVMASNLEQIYFLSQRSNATAESIKAIGFAAAQVGSSVDAARGSLEHLGRFLWSNPAAETFIGSLGVQTRDANGKLRETGVIMNDLIRQIRTRPPAIQEALAGIIGIDVNLLRAGGAEFEKEQARHRRIYAAAHIDAKRATEDSHFLNSEWRALGAAVGALGDKISATFSRQTGELINRFSTWLTNNFDKIVAVIEWAATTITDFGKVFVDFAKGLWQMALDAKGAWDKLDNDSKMLLGIIAAVTAAVIAFNAAWALSPITLIGLLGAAIATLYLDYKQWKDGAQSPIDWKTWGPVLEEAEAGFVKIGTAIKDLGVTVKNVLGAMFKEHEHAFDELFDAKAIAKNIKEITEAISVIPKTMEGYVKLYGGIATGNWKLALEGLQQIKDVTMGEGAPPFMQPFGEMVGEQERQGPWWSQMGRWARGKLGFGAVPATNAVETAISPEGRGLLDTIAGHEAPGYNALYGGGSFASYTEHPNKPIPIPGRPGMTSTAAGRYQFLHGTWEEARAALKLPDFSPQSQDRAAWWLANRDYKKNTGRDLAADLNSPDPAVRGGIGRALAGTWTSLAGGIESTTTDNRFLRELGEHTRREQALTSQVPGTGIAAPRPERTTEVPLVTPPPTPGQALEEVERRRRAAGGERVPDSIAKMERERGLPPGSLGDLRFTPREPVVATPLPDVPRLTPNVGAVGAGPIVGPQSSISNDNSRDVALNQENNITVHVANSDGYAIGRSVLEAQRTLSQQMARDAASRVG